MKIQSLVALLTPINKIEILRKVKPFFCPGLPVEVPPFAVMLLFLFLLKAGSFFDYAIGASLFPNQSLFLVDSRNRLIIQTREIR
jgi:hypothetical protein